MQTLTLVRRCRTGWQASGSLIRALTPSRNRLLFTDDLATRPGGEEHAGPPASTRVSGASMAPKSAVMSSSLAWSTCRGAWLPSLAGPNNDYVARDVAVLVAGGRGGGTGGKGNTLAPFPIGFISRSRSSTSSSSSSIDFTVVEDGTEKFLVAARVLEANQVIFARVEGLVTGVKTRHSVQVSKERHLEARCDLVFLNHSCEPNCQLEVVDAAEQPYLRVTVRAPRIQPNELLTIDYNAMEIDMSCPFDCQCGAVRCRGLVSGFSNLSRAEQKEYIDGGATRSPPLTGAVKTWAEEHDVV
ncbi:unnamed protein product [Ectocarpus sp. 12 AP-2014]